MAKRTIQQPVTKKQEDAADALMAAITNLGQVQQQKVSQPGSPLSQERRSRFFFTPTISFSEDVKRRQQKIKPKEVELLDEQVEARRKTYVKQFPQKLNKNLEAVREYWLRDIAPLALASVAGSEQAREVIQKTLGTEIDGSSFAQFNVMVQKGVQIKSAEYIVKFLGLPKGSAEELLDIVKIHKPTQREIVYVDPNSDRRARPTPTKVEEDEDE
jgi:hypothetical protein